ncbi:hypothetical protein K3495_g1980 [Podosphaera aphanis]|nr:hypothetical protein K3495_g1980 [Podosphaera aphanis]
MLADAVSARVKITAFLSSKSDLFFITDGDWDEIQLIVGLLERMQSCMDELSKRESKINLAAPIYFQLYEYLDEVATGSGKYQNISHSFRAAFKNGQKKFKKYFLEADSIVTFYTFSMLDPRLKGDFIIESLREDNNSGMLIVSMMQENMRKIFGDLEGRNSRITPDIVSSNNEMTIQTRMQKRMRTLDTQSSFDRYFSENPIPYTIETESKDWVLKWWLNHQDEYPFLAAAVEHFLCIPISTLSVERLFGMVGNISWLRRHEPDLDSMMMLMILHQNMKHKEISHVKMITVSRFSEAKNLSEDVYHSISKLRV